jgi:hypothetical protein
MATGYHQFIYNFADKDMTTYIAYRVCIEKIREFIDYSEQIIENYSKMDPNSEHVLYYRTYRNVFFNGMMGDKIFNIRYFEIRKYLHFFQNLYHKHFHDNELEKKFEIFKNDIYGLGGKQDWVEYLQEQMVRINDNEKSNKDIMNSFKNVENCNKDHEIEIYYYSRKFWKMSYMIEGIISTTRNMKSLRYDREIGEYVYNPKPDEDTSIVSFRKPNNELHANLWDENTTYITKLDMVYANYLEKKNKIKYNIIKMRQFKRASIGLRGM